MDTDAQSLFRLLNEHSSDEICGPSECVRLLSILNTNLTEEQVDSSVIDSYLLYMFETNGIVPFVVNVASKKPFKKSAIEAFEIIYSLINNFPRLLEKYILIVNDLCLKVNQSSASYEVKIKALEVLIVSFEKVDKCLENQEHYLNVFEQLQKCLSFGHSDTVKQRELIAVGLFSKKFAYMITDPEKIKKLFINALDETMLRKKSQSIICGAFTGLEYYCESFPLSLDNNTDRNIIKKLYKYLLELRTPKEKMKFGNRAAFSFFSVNMDLFVIELLAKFKDWHGALISWLKMGAEELKTGINTMKAFFVCISKALMDIPTEECAVILNHFVSWSKKALNTDTLSTHGKKLAIHCLKSFSNCCFKHMSSAQMNELFLYIMETFEKSYVLNQDASSENWEFLPDFIQCVASFMQKNITPNYMFCLQRGTVNMISTFHRLEASHRNIVIDAVVHVLFCLKSSKYFDSFLENVVYQGIVFSCSHQLISETDITDDSKDIITVKNYFPLWINILKLQTNRSYDKYGIYLEDRRKILTAIVNHFIKSLMVLINKLDVTVRVREQEDNVTDIENMYKVSKTDDYAIFLNVVDFYQEILTHIDAVMFERCITKLINHLIDKCLNNPFVSGFYKLLSYKLKIANKLKLFDSDNVTLNQDVHNCRDTLTKFLHIILHKMQQFKDELLISCLHVLLQMPTVIVRNVLNSCSSVFVTIFELGRSHIALAHAGLDTLEHWQKNIDKEEFEPFLIKVVPSLDAYIRSKSLGSLMKSSIVERRRKTSRALKKRKVIVELEPELVKFQQKILRFVGSQNSKVCQAFVCFDNNITSAIVGENSKHIEITLPYDGMNLNLYLEPFIPRLVDLALNCSDRKSRITACELLQASMVLFLGKTKPMTDLGLSELDGLLKCVVTALLHLSCDVDQIVRQIFEPLFLQMIHWYTSTFQLRKRHAALIIETITDGVTHPTNTSIRDFSGRCINEYVKWTIKQTNEKQLSSDPVNIKVLIKKMRFFGSYPDFSKKLGAALIFNNIYREIREEEALVSIFWLEILDILIESLAAIEKNDLGVEATVSETNKALQHWKRVFLSKVSLLKRKDEKRRIPKSMENGSLVSISCWLLEKSCCKSQHCRQASMDLFEALADVGIKKTLTDKGVNYKLKYEERLKNYPTLNEIKNHEDCSVLIKWLQALLCAIDGHIFLVKNGLLTTFEEESCTIKSVMYFLENVQGASFEEALNLILRKSWIFTSIDKTQFDDLKASCNFAILNFACVLIKFLNNTTLFCNSFYKLIVNAVFNTKLLGFDHRIEKCKHLILLDDIFTNMKRHNSVKEFVTIIHSYIKENPLISLEVMRNVRLKQRNLVNGLLFLNKSQIGDELNLKQYTNGLVNSLLMNFYENVEGKVIIINDLPQTVTEYCSSILEFALNNDDEFKALVTHFFNGYTVRSASLEYQKEIPFGIFLLNTFEDVLVDTLLNNFSSVLDNFLNEATGIDYMMYVLKIVSKHRRNEKRRDIVSTLLQSWEKLESIFNENGVKNQIGLEFLSLIQFFDAEDVPIAVLEWLLILLSKETYKNDAEFQLQVFALILNYTTETHEIYINARRLILQTFSSNILELSKTKPLIIEKVLLKIPSCKCVEVLQYLLDIHLNVNVESEIVSNLSKFIIAANENVQEKSLKLAYGYILKENLDFKQKLKVVNDILPPLLQNCNLNIFEQFYVEHISSIAHSLTSDDNISKALNFVLVEILFSRISLGSLERVDCPIIAASNNQKIRMVLVKSALDTLKIQNQSGEITRIVKCKAYKALASIFTNCEEMKKDAFFEKLFYRAENGEDVLWKGLIDTSVSYNFPLEFDSLPKQRKILINIRDELRNKNKKESQFSLRYIESQRLFNSSLSEDITKYDFTTSTLRQNRTEPEIIDVSVGHSEIYLDSTEINNHECMATICGIIRFIFESDVNELPKEDDDDIQLPIWMDGIRKVLLSEKAHKNVKIFLVKLIENMDHIFRHFAKCFVGPLLKFISDKCAGDSINYFVMDVLVIIASWAKYVTTPDENSMSYVSPVLSFLIEKLDNDRQDMFKYNLDLVKLVIENWREHICEPYDQILKKFECDINNRKIEVAIHLSSVFLANNLPACKNKDIFWQKIMKTMESNVKSIYRPCAETVGLFLKYLSNNSIENYFEKDIQQFVRNLSDIDKYAFTLEGIAIHYPRFINEFHLCRMIDRLSQSPTDLKILFLKVINKSTEELNEVADFKRLNWGTYVEHEKLEIELVTLEIIIKTLDILKDSTLFNDILKSVSKILQSPNVLSRSLAYDIFMSVLNREISDEEGRLLCRDALIQGLADADPENREKVKQFWSEHHAVPLQITDKFCYLLSELYAPKTEHQFLGYACYLLLNSLNNEDKDLQLIKDPLEDCKFEDYKLQLNWRLKHPSEVPLFAETLRSSQEYFEPYSESGFNQLRNTQVDLSFTPTQSVRDTEILKVTNITSTLHISSVDEGVFKNPNDLKISQMYKLPKRRFLKDRSKISAQFAHREVRKQIDMTKKRRDAVTEGEKKVMIYRNYRKGDFPDVQIRLFAVLRPLQMLALFDPEISKLLFSNIFKSLSNNVENNVELLDSVLSSIKRIFTNSSQFNSNLFSTLLDILLKNSSKIMFDPQLLTAACQQSGLTSVGTLLLEEYIIFHTNDGPSQNKKGSCVESPDKTLWLKLAELYRELEEWDLVRTIFIEKIHCKDSIRLAITYEADKRWREAQQCYHDLIETDISVERRDFYYESYFKCLAHLGEWNELSKEISSVVSGGASTWQALWDKDWCQQKLLPWYVTSHVRNGLFVGNIDRGFLSDLNSSYLKPEENEYLRSKFSEELCMLWLFQKNEAQACQYLKDSLQNFLSDWQLLNPVFESLRYSKLLRLCNVVEVDRFISVESNVNDESEDALKQLQDYWKDTQSEFLPSILLSEAKLLYRRLFIKLLTEKLVQFKMTDVEEQLQETKTLLDINFMNVAIDNENYYMARQYYKEYKDYNSEKFMFSFSLIYGNIAYLKSKITSKLSDQFDILLMSSKKFASLLDTNIDTFQKLEAAIKYLDINSKIYEILSQNIDIYQTNVAELTEAFGDVSSPQIIPLKAAEQLKNCLTNESFDEMMDCDSNVKHKITRTETTAKAFIKFAYFVKDDNDRVEDFILYVLRAMKLHSKEARQLFPCILLEENLGTCFKNVFLKESEVVPTWMFLGWIPQLLANVDTKKVGAISGIILRIAEAYPQSIMYAYRLSKETYNEQDNTETKNLLQKLDDLLLSDVNIDAFLKALSYVSVPSAALMYYLKKIAMSKSKHETMRIQPKILEEFFEQRPNSKDPSCFQGNMYKQIKRFENKIKDLSTGEIAEICNKSKQIYNDLKTVTENSEKSLLLQDYCPWLARFSSNKFDSEIEIPGQYTGDKMPLIQHHVKISGFLPNVQIMSSLRKPIKITMLGMDAKEYPFLVKFGEDIRQDQRIEQLFTLMNGIFVKDNKNLSILTYQVIPLTSSLGLIEWVDPTVPLRKFLTDPFQNEKIEKRFERAREQYRGFLSSGKIEYHTYGYTAIRKDRNKLIPFFQTLVNSLPLDMLKKSFWTLASTTEDFIALRSNFVKSYAVICGCQWILGIGDRHLSNFLVCTKNGRVLGIDFGQAFGFGTEHLPIPDLVPFRLTPRVLGLMEPLREKGSFRDVLIATLSSLRNNSDLLLATMDVFVREPSIDWLETASKYGSEGTSHEWYPKKKIEQARRKLNGASSAEITIELLRANNIEKQFIEAYIRHVRGSAEHNLRARMNVDGRLTVEEQVDSLIDHAVDYNVLGRMYCGWDPWV